MAQIWYKIVLANDKLCSAIYYALESWAFSIECELMLLWNMHEENTHSRHLQHTKFLIHKRCVKKTNIAKLSQATLYCWGSYVRISNVKVESVQIQFAKIWTSEALLFQLFILQRFLAKLTECKEKLIQQTGMLYVYTWKTWYNFNLQAR